jgi:adenylate cyclase
LQLTDWDYFNHLLESNINLTVPLKTADQLERELNAFMTAIQEAARNSTPVIKTKLKVINFPKEIRNFIFFSLSIKNSNLVLH